jgi:hypothetical protein
MTLAGDVSNGVREKSVPGLSTYVFCLTLSTSLTAPSLRTDS